VALVTNLFGYSLGPPIVGAAIAAGGLQWTLLLPAIGNLWAFNHFFMVTRHHGELVQATSANAHPHQ